MSERVATALNPAYQRAALVCGVVTGRSCPEKAARQLRATVRYCYMVALMR
jgi:hypothetical protein